VTKDGVDTVFSIRFIYVIKTEWTQFLLLDLSA